MIYSIIKKKKRQEEEKEKKKRRRRRKKYNWKGTSLYVSLHETEAAVCIFGGRYTYLVHLPACVLPLFYKHYKLCIIVYLDAVTETETLVDLIR